MPLSPPLSTSGDMLQTGFPHLVQHNSNTFYPQVKYDEDSHMQSSCGSPAPTQDEGIALHGQHLAHLQDARADMEYNRYGMRYQSPAYPDRYDTPTSSLPTPLMHNMSMLRTRSGLWIPRSRQVLLPGGELKPRVQKMPRMRKPRKDKPKPEKKIAKLEQPLSILTKDWKHVPVVDIEAYVNRSKEVRIKEVEDGKVPGRVKRPMNSFMLYRKAYQNRTKDWCLQNNHQVVSQVCGDSWPLEPESVKEQYSEWARIERINHQNAHPGYKFSPTKPGAIKSSKRKMSEDPMSEDSDLDDFDWRGETSKRAKGRRDTPETSELQQPVSYPTTRSAYQYTPSRETSMEPYQGGYNPSSYQASNPGKPLPPQYQAHLENGEYFQQSIVNHNSLAGVSDVFLKRASAPGVHSYLGLPGAGRQEYDMMAPVNSYDQQPVLDHRIDPSLMDHDPQMYSGNHYGGSHHGLLYPNEFHNANQHYQQSFGLQGLVQHDPAMPYLGAEQSPGGMAIHDQQMHVLKGHQDAWHIESLETGAEFDKWMDEEH